MVGFLEGLVLKVDMGRCGLYPKMGSSHSSMYIHTERKREAQRETETEAEAEAETETQSKGKP